MKKLTNNSGFASFVEVIVTAVIFALASASVMTTITLFRPQGMEAARRLEAAYVGKRFLDGLRQNIDATEWINDSDGDPLDIGIHPSSGTIDIPSSDGTFNYTIWYEVVSVPGAADPPIRKIDLHVEYPD